jgi:hypothetical protein
MKKFLTVLDGWKLLIGVVITILVGVYDHATGHKTSDIVGTLLTLLGYNPLQNGVDGSAIGSAVGALAVLAGLIGKFWKAQQQIRAGSSVAGALSAEGYAVSHEVALNAGKPEAMKVEEKAQTAVMVAEAGK